MDDTALAQLQQAVQERPEDVDARLALLQALIAVERWPDAAQLGEALVQLAAPPAAVYALLGLVLGKQGRLEEAVQHYRQALTHQPDDALCLLNLGMLLARQDEYQSAREHLEKAIAQIPTWPEAHYTLGTVLVQQERYYEAIRAFDRATEQRTPYPEAHFNRGNAHALKGLEADGSLDYYEMDRAIDAYKLAVQQRPGYTAALYNLGMVYQRLRSAEGLRVWDQYLEAAQAHADEAIWCVRAQEYKRDLQDRLSP